VGIHVPKSHLVELVGDEIEDVFAIRLGGVAAIAVVPAYLFQVVAQIAHRYLLSFPFIRTIKTVVEASFLLSWCMRVGKCFCSPGAPVAAAGEIAEHGTPLPLCAVGLLLAGAAQRFGWRRDGRFPGEAPIARVIHPRLTERR
jgi:hypothetical protein